MLVSILLKEFHEFFIRIPSFVSQTELNNGGGDEEVLPKQQFRKRAKGMGKKEQRKKRRNLGECYKTAKGKEVEAKTFRNINCNCKNKCLEKVSIEARQNAFNMFWKIGTFSTQNAFLCGLVKQQEPDRRRPRGGTKVAKSTTNHFHVILLDGTSVKVCKKYFLNTYQVSDGRMTRALKVVKRGQSPGTDKRGKRVPINKIPEEQMAVVRQHISSYPSYQSHYTRAHNPNRSYLPEHLNIRLMYNMYKTYCNERDVIPVKEPIYRRTFNREFNLHFHQPHKDTCTKCDIYKNKIDKILDEEQKSTLKVEHELHLKKAESARENMSADAEKSKTDNAFYVFTFDLEKSLAFPKLTCQIAYYKRNCYLYNLGCHELSSKVGFMYCWDETVGSRGSQEIGACVVKHIHTRASSAKHVVMYSDSCTGQNRNFKMSLILMRFLQGENSGEVCVIDQKFMQSGHSYLPNDCDFASIENRSKTKQIYCPNDWYEVIIQARKKNPFHLTVMTSDDFLSTKNLENLVTRRKSDSNELPINWLKIQWLRYKKSHPFTIFFKETLMEDMPFSELDITPTKKRGRPVPLSSIPMDKLYDGVRPVTKAKKKDMMDLLPYIPPISQEFFLQLQTSDTVEDIGPLAEADEQPGH